MKFRGEKDEFCGTNNPNSAVRLGSKFRGPWKTVGSAHVYSIDTVSELLAKDPYVASKVAFEHATFWTQGTEPTTESPRPHRMFFDSVAYASFFWLAFWAVDAQIG